MIRYLALVLIMASPAIAQTGASYEDTVNYLQERLSTSFVATGPRCMFQDTVKEGPGTILVHMEDLQPHIIWTYWRTTGTIKCSSDKGCVTVENAGNGVGNGPSQWSFSIHDAEEQPHVEKAILHLLELCGVPPEKDPF